MRGPVALTFISLFALIFFLGFIALGIWQVYRLSWKLDLIDRVNHRVHAPPIAAPPPSQWAAITPANDEYLHVRVHGIWLDDRQTLVHASTEIGSGFWLITPLREADGSIVLINRGFVSSQWCGRTGQCARDPNAQADVTGLLRMTEPRGGFLTRNDPAAERWYSRDVQAIAAKRQLAPVAPYFIDADPNRAATDTSGQTSPVGGLTVTTFPNNHLVYAITWFVLALMVAAGAWYVSRDEYRLRRELRGTQP